MKSQPFAGKRVLITGGTGSLGKTLLRRLLSGQDGKPEKIVIFSRDESKQYALRAQYERRAHATHDIVYETFRSALAFRIGDISDISSLAPALRDIDIVLNAAAMKQVPTCEYFPDQAVATNVIGAENIVRAIRDNDLPVETVVGVSTDKAVQPINAMGMTKALQERIFIRGNLEAPGTRFVCVRYGNVLASRGSVIPLFHEQIRSGGPVTVTHKDMTRFLLTLEDGVDTILAAMRNGNAGEIAVPRISASRIADLAEALVDGRPIEIRISGIRPGEKLHEVLIADEERRRVRWLDGYYFIKPLLPELSTHAQSHDYSMERPYRSDNEVMTRDQVFCLLRDNRLMLDQLDDTADRDTLR